MIPYGIIMPPIIIKSTLSEIEEAGSRGRAIIAVRIPYSTCTSKSSPSLS